MDKIQQLTKQLLEAIEEAENPAQLEETSRELESLAELAEITFWLYEAGELTESRQLYPRYEQPVSPQPHG